MGEERNVLDSFRVFWPCEDKKKTSEISADIAVLAAEIWKPEVHGVHIGQKIPTPRKPTFLGTSPLSL